MLMPAAISLHGYEPLLPLACIIAAAVGLCLLFRVPRSAFRVKKRTINHSPFTIH